MAENGSLSCAIRKLPIYLFTLVNLVSQRGTVWQRMVLLVVQLESYPSELVMALAPTAKRGLDSRKNNPL